MNANIEARIQSALADVAKRGKPDNIYFVGCGGSFAQMNVPKYAFDRESKTIAIDSFSSAEFIARNSPRVGKTTVVILCSKSGDTPETAAAAKYASDRGAYTIGLTVEENSPLAKAVHTRVDYDAVPDAGTPDAAAAVLLRIGFGILAQHDANTKLGGLLDGLKQMPKVVEAIQQQHRQKALDWGQARKREPVIYTMASGANYGVAYLWAICILQEMQWINSQAIHSGEYFHGPFEITDFDVPFMVLKGVGDTRKIDQRALDFANKFSDKILEIDASEFAFDGIDEGVREYLTPLVFLPLLRIYANALADARGHPLTVRRYMWKMDY